MTGPSPEDLARSIRAGDRRALARAITLVESTRTEHQTRAAELLERLGPGSADTIRLGVSGVPGVGKSTFVEALGRHVVSSDHRIAVLSVDPSSALSGGSILGDKTRMAELARHPAAFIRPSPAGSAHGGVARHTREAIVLCESSGFDVVVVETVGVGQAESAVADMTDMFLLLLMPAAGDELQGIKRGIVELADLVLVNKADGELAEAAGRTAAEYANAVQLLRPRSREWEVRVATCSALTGAGIAEAWALVEKHHAHLAASGELQRRRAEQARSWLWAEIAESLLAALKRSPRLERDLARAEKAVVEGRTTAAAAARALVDAFAGEGKD